MVITLSSSTNSTVQVDNSLHTLNVVGYFCQLCAKKALLS